MYINGYVPYTVSPRILCPASCSLATHTYISEIPFVAQECGGGDSYHCHLGGRMPSDKTV